MQRCKKAAVGDYPISCADDCPLFDEYFPEDEGRKFHYVNIQCSKGRLCYEVVTDNRSKR